MQVGFLLDENGTQKIRYSRSQELIRARYRITLQYVEDEEHTPYVVDVIRSKESGGLDIRPENEPVREVWLKSEEPRYRELCDALETIYRQDIEEGNEEHDTTTA